MTKAITLRLDASDHAALTEQAGRLKVRPGTLARMLVHASLTEGRFGNDAPLSAIERLVQRSHHFPKGDAVALVDDARTSVGGE